MKEYGMSKVLMQILARAPIAAALLMAGLAVASPARADEAPVAEAVPAQEVAAPLPETTPLVERATVLEGASGGGDPVPLTLDTALLTAVTFNRELDVARLGPPISETFVPEARAAFDPVLTGSLSAAHNARGQLSSANSSTNLSNLNNPAIVGDVDTALEYLSAAADAIREVQSLVDTVKGPAEVVTETDDVQTSVGLQQRAPTGTTVALSASGARNESNLSTDYYDAAWGISISQPLLRGAGTKVNLVALRQAKNEAVRSTHVLRQDVLDLINRVEQQYWERVLAAEVLKIREFAVTLADEQLRRNRDLLDVGRAIQADVFAAEAEESSRVADLVRARADTEAQDIALVRLLNPQAERVWEIRFNPTDAATATGVPVAANESEKLALDYRPELPQAELDLTNAGLDVVAAKNNRLPQLDLVASYGVASLGETSSRTLGRLGDDRYDNYSVGIEFSMPILRRAEKARHRRAELGEDRALAALDNLAQAISAQARQAVIEVVAQQERLAATQQTVKGREEQLRVEEGRNRAGKTTNLDLLRVQRDFVQAQVDEATARITYAKALTALYAAEGTLLERRGIVFDEAPEATE